MLHENGVIRYMNETDGRWPNASIQRMYVGLRLLMQKLLLSVLGYSRTLRWHTCCFPTYVNNVALGLYFQPSQ